MRADGSWRAPLKNGLCACLERFRCGAGLARSFHSPTAHLRGGIIRLAGLAFLAIDRGKTDDPAKTSLAHAFDHRVGHVEQRMLMRQRLRQAPVKSVG